MTKDAFMEQIKLLVANFSPEQKIIAQQIMTEMHQKYMCWSHCQHCGLSNHRMYAICDEEYKEIKEKSKDAVCIHCGHNSIVVYSGFTNGVISPLPSRSDILDMLHITEEQTEKIKLEIENA